MNMIYRKITLGFFLLVFLSGMASASSVIGTIVDDKILIEIDLSDGASVIFPEKYSLLEENGNHISFISKDVLNKNSEWILVLPRVVDSAYDLKIYLPRGHILVNDLVYPKDYNLSSDGTSIILNWKDFNEEETLIFYESVEESSFWFWVIILYLILIGFWVFGVQKKKFFRELERLKSEAKNKNKISKDVLITRNLFGEEKRIVEFLKERKSCWTKELVRELGISKVMASRKIRSLVEKGIIEKENFRKENKISLKISIDAPST